MCPAALYNELFLRLWKKRLYRAVFINQLIKKADKAAVDQCHYKRAYANAHKLSEKQQRKRRCRNKASGIKRNFKLCAVLL